MVQHLLQLVQVAHLDLYLQALAVVLAPLARLVDRGHDTASKVHMVVLEQNHVKQADAVVAPAADLHSLLFQHAHARSRLACVQHARLQALKALGIASRGGRHTAHALHDVEHQALGLQQRAHPARHHKGHIARHHVGAVADHHLHAQLWVKFLKHASRDLHTSQDALFLDDQPLASHLVGRDAAQRGRVTVADVLGQRQVDQLIDQFFSRLHEISVFFILFSDFRPQS